MAWRGRWPRARSLHSRASGCQSVVEIALEGGLLALIAFTFGVMFTLWRWGAFDARNRDIMIMLALWLLIVWQFVQTFPRLDLWIAFWVVLVWTRRSSRVGSAETRSRRPQRRRIASGSAKRSTKDDRE